MTDTTPHSAPSDVLEVTLLPCPFCGGEARLYPVIMPFDADCDAITVQCGGCDTIGANVLVDQDVHDQSDLPALEAEAVAAWNTRVPLPLAGSPVREETFQGKPLIWHKLRRLICNWPTNEPGEPLDDIGNNMPSASCADDLIDAILALPELTPRAGEDRCPTCGETNEAFVCSDGFHISLAALSPNVAAVENMQPQIVDKTFGPEPSWRMLVTKYYREHYGDDEAGRLTDQYFAALRNLGGERG